jgi:hypothetical protein
MPSSIQLNILFHMNEIPDENLSKSAPGESSAGLTLTLKAAESLSSVAAP